MDVSSAAATTEESYAFNVDGSTVMKVYGVASGGGVLTETALVVEADYQYMGDPNTNGSWRFYVSSVGDLVFEKRISGYTKFRLHSLNILGTGRYYQLLGGIFNKKRFVINIEKQKSDNSKNDE